VHETRASSITQQQQKPKTRPLIAIFRVCIQEIQVYRITGGSLDCGQRQCIDDKWGSERGAEHTMQELEGDMKYDTLVYLGVCHVHVYV
jgi:hypothetical protein